MTSPDATKAQPDPVAVRPAIGPLPPSMCQATTAGRSGAPRSGRTAGPSAIWHTTTWRARPGSQRPLLPRVQTV